MENLDYHTLIYLYTGKTIMGPKRILIVNIESLLIGVAESLLQNNGNFAVVNIYPKDLGSLLRSVERVNPDVILMDEDTYFMEPLRLLSSLRRIPNIRVIVLSNRKMFVTIYDMYECTISNPSQLVDAIQSDKRFINAD